ncbi:MAG: hypothetical protein LBQ24_03530 [Candidatus Peribacteria bacterium]|jgi:hypothetical protein|nr:hypothetical protein [Candidatus Peribacteria bacterium]
MRFVSQIPSLATKYLYFSFFFFSQETSLSIIFQYENSNLDQTLAVPVSTFFPNETLLTKPSKSLLAESLLHHSCLNVFTKTSK